MKPEVSALMDGELDHSAANSLITRLQSDHELQSTWHVYHRIGDCLRQEHLHDEVIGQKIFASLAAEPTILAPRKSSTSYVPLIATALAASVATVAVVSWFGMQQSTSAPQTAALAPTVKQEVSTLVAMDKPAVTANELKSVALLPVPAPAVVSLHNMQDYVFAHQEFSPAPGVMQVSLGARR
jgi:sigma-E factor negative regulatory protein RseA